jgi:hypothetical protein
MRPGCPCIHHLESFKWQNLTLLDRAGQAKSRKRPVLPVRIELQKNSKKRIKIAKSQQAPDTREMLRLAKANPDALRVKVPDPLVAVEQREKLRLIISV